MGERLEAVHDGHRQVEHHEVGVLLAHDVDAGGTVTGLADHLPAGAAERDPQQLAEVLGVVDEDDAGCRAHRSSSSRTPWASMVEG